MSRQFFIFKNEILLTFSLYYDIIKEYQVTLEENFMKKLNFKGLLALTITSIIVTSLAVGNVAIAETVAQNNKANQPAYWVDYFKISNLTCTKYELVKTPFIAPASNSGVPIYATIVKAGAGDTANEIDRTVKPGDEIVHSSGKENSHVIVCYGSASKPLGDSGIGDVTPDENNPGKPEKDQDDQDSETPLELPKTGSNKLAQVFGLGSLTSASLSWAVSVKRRR